MSFSLFQCQIDVLCVGWKQVVATGLLLFFAGFKNLHIFLVSFDQNDVQTTNHCASEEELEN
jgi:hypothetical protein